VPRKKGHPKTGGRKKGTPNYRGSIGKTVVQKLEKKEVKPVNHPQQGTS
jgi:hypothetical protein